MCAVCHQMMQACRLLTNTEYESKQTWKMDIDELFSKDETGAGTLTMISAEMIGLLKEHLDKQSEVRNGEDHNITIPIFRICVIRHVNQLFYCQHHLNCHPLGCFIIID
jgi:hypothetical protein